eukprot:1161477-Pelagomonas_calceolata.AAC.4
MSTSVSFPAVPSLPAAPFVLLSLPLANRLFNPSSPANQLEEAKESSPVILVTSSPVNFFSPANRLVLEEAKKVAASQANQPLSPQQLKAVREQVASKQRAAAGEKQKEAAAKPAAGIPFLSPPKPAETPAPKVVPAAAAP